MEQIIEKKESDEIKKIFSQNLLFFRKKINISQKELAEKLQTSNKNISKWERAETIPDILTIKKLASIFNVSIDTLVSPITDEHKKAIVNKSAIPFRWKICFLGVILGLILLFSCILFFVLESLKIDEINTFFVFIYMLPFMDITIFVFICIVSKKVDPISLSIFGWLVALCFYLSFINAAKAAYVFIIALAFQIIAPLFATLINSRKIITFNKLLLSKLKRSESDETQKDSANETTN